jgi:hypothetical protein
MLPGWLVCDKTTRIRLRAASLLIRRNSNPGQANPLRNQTLSWLFDLAPSRIAGDVIRFRPSLLAAFL